MSKDQIIHTESSKKMIEISRPTVVRLDEPKKKRKKEKKITYNGYIQLSLYDFFISESIRLRNVGSLTLCNNLFSTNQCKHTSTKIMICKDEPGHFSPHTAYCKTCDTTHINNTQFGIGKVYRAINYFPLSIADITRIVELPATNVRTYIKTLNNKGIVVSYQDNTDMRKRQVELNPLWIYQ